MARLDAEPLGQVVLIRRLASGRAHVCPPILSRAGPHLMSDTGRHRRQVLPAARTSVGTSCWDSPLWGAALRKSQFVQSELTKVIIRSSPSASAYSAR